MPDETTMLVTLRDTSIAERQTACREASQGSPLETAPGLVGQLVEIHVAEQRLHSERDLGFLAGRVDTVSHADQRYVQVPQLPKQVTRVGQVPGDARHVFDDDRVDPARSLSHELHQLLEAIP